MNTFSLLRGIRFLDSFFPSGGYAYSSGLEAAVQGGAVRNAEDLTGYVSDYLRGGLGSREAVAAGLARDAASHGTFSIALDADRELETMQLCRETRMASRQMGRQVIRIACDRDDAPSILRDFLAEVESGRSPGHLAVSLGLTLGAFGWNKQETVAASLYQSAAGLVSAALKLLPIGQREGQRLLESWLPLIEKLSREAESRTEMASWTPVQDIYAMKHSRLESRLFRS
ncbi:MAG: urease accessory protein UreF [Nitrospiraceae bacterium]